MKNWTFTQSQTGFKANLRKIYVKGAKIPLTWFVNLVVDLNVEGDFGTMSKVNPYFSYRNRNSLILQLE